MANQTLSRATLARLVVLSAKLNRAVTELETIAAKRDARAGTFTNAGTLSAKSVRAAWSTAGRPVNRNNFKTDLLNALRAPRR